MGRLESFDRPVIKPWKRGWYPGVVVSEYESQGSPVYTFKTEDRPTQNGSGSRQVQLCIGLVNDKDVRYFNYGVYYNPDNLFDQEYVGSVLAMAKEYKKGRWADTTMQRDYMSFVQLHEIEKSLNEGRELDQEGSGLSVEHLVGKDVDAFYSVYHKVEKDGKKFTDEVPIQILKDYEAGKCEWEKGWFGGIKYLDVIGNHTAKDVKQPAPPALVTAAKK